jgi:hypothetical protein
MTRAARRAATPVSVLLLLALAAGGCSGDDSTEPDAQPSSASGSPKEKAPPEVHTQVSLGHVPGKLSAEAGRRAARNVGKVVDRWFDAAYVGGRYPRQDFRDAFPGFTPGASASAHRDRALMSNQPLGPHIDGVTATQRLVWVDVLPAGGRAAAATARFRLGFTTTGKAERSVVVRGRLFLTPGPHGWKVFGYDVAKGAPDELAPPSPPKKKPDDKKSDGKSDRKKSEKHQKHEKKGGGR